MVEAHEIKHGGVEIVNVYGVFGDVIAKIIGLAIHAWLDPAAGHPDGETAGMMVAAIVIRAELSLAIVGTAEFAAPDHEGQGKLSPDNYGRDHHPRCFTIWMAGGGI